MRNLILLFFSSLILVSCNSEEEVQRLKNKSFQIVVQKYLDEYDAEYQKLYSDVKEEEIAGNDSIRRIQLKEFLTSEDNLKKIKGALDKKESLKKEQVEKLEGMLISAQKK